jgi:hypothetical protein
MPTILSRRSMIKSMIAGATMLAAAPYLAKASAFQQGPGVKNSEVAGSATRPNAQRSDEQPLVLIVKGDRILGYKGLNEMRVQDSSLAGMLNNRFGSMGAGN